MMLPLNTNLVPIVGKQFVGLENSPNPVAYTQFEIRCDLFWIFTPRKFIQICMDRKHSLRKQIQTNVQQSLLLQF